MQRKRKQNSENSSTKHRNGATNNVQNQKLDAGGDKIAQNESENGLNSSEQNALDSDVSCSTKAGTRGLLKSFCGVSCIGVLKVVILVIIVPPFLNYASLQRESASLRPHDELHDGPRGNKLFMNCSGKGLPVVMMDTPGGYSSDVWLLVQANIAKFTKVCVYDRAGLGFSERATPRFHDNQHENMSSDVPDLKYEQLRPTTENMAADIHHLLKNISKSTNDVLLVGGGLGAINARFYASFYENIFGIVLINPFHENMFADKDWEMFWYERFLPSLQMQQISAALGITRLGIITGLYKSSLLEEGHFDNEVLIRLKYLSCNLQHLSAGIMERYYMNESLAQLKILQKLKPFPKNISVSLISSKNFSDSLPQSLNQFWFKNQELFVRELFPKGSQMIVDSDFNAVYFRSVEIIVKAIKKLVNKFRKSVKQSANI
jgi:pimeloyl-ACP methyl ester carboxylesterase